jgi:hypothetical protein
MLVQARFTMTTQFELNTSKALLEVQAIDAVRLELANAVKAEMPQSVISEIHTRLISLYASFDAHNVESIIQRIKFNKAA